MKHIGRKLYHLLGGLGLLSLYYLLGRRNALISYGILIALVLVVDITRLRVPAFNRFIQERFSSFIRKNEADKLTGTAPYVLGIGLALLLYRTDIATAAICFLACGDVAVTNRVFVPAIGTLLMGIFLLLWAVPVWAVSNGFMFGAMAAGAPPPGEVFVEALDMRDRVGAM